VRGRRPEPLSRAEPLPGMVAPAEGRGHVKLVQGHKVRRLTRECPWLPVGVGR
jgi:hypothetical protein